MTRRALILCLVAMCMVARTASAQVEKFQYRAERVQPGIVYHYVKTNIDGTHPEWISIYVPKKDQIVSFKFHPKDPPAALVTADMDWATFSVKRLESLHVLGDGSRKTMAVLDYNDKERAVFTALPGLNKPDPEKTPIAFLPFHIYNFDLASLNFAFRHLLQPDGSFKVGLADPTFKQDGPAFFYRGEVDVSYSGDEQRGGALCRKYRINGPGLENRGGFIWVHKAAGYVTDMEIDLPDNPDWQTFKFKLEKVERMTPDAWDAFMTSQLR